MNKVLRDAEEAVALIPDGATIMMGGFGLSRHPGKPHRRAAPPRHEGPHHHQQQRRHRRLRHRPAAQRTPGAEDDCDLRRREQGIRAPVPAEGNRGRAGAARHVLGADARRRARAFPRSTRRPATARSSPRARRRATFDGRPTCSSVRCTPTSPSSKPGKGDRVGNLAYRRTARNFNPVMATAASFTIAEVEHLVSPARSIPTRCTRRAST